MSSRRWILQQAGLLLIFAAVLLIGWMSGYPLLALLLALAAYATWHLVNLTNLRHWLHNPVRKAPQSYGAWADVFDTIGLIQSSNRGSNQRIQMELEDFQILTDAFPDATVVVNENLEITWFNRAAGTLLNLRQKKDIGRAITTIIHDSEFKSWLAAAGESKSRLEIPAPGQSDVWLDLSTVPIRNRRKMIIFHDASEIHHVERLRRDFVTNVSHELRTPLTVMLGYLEIFQDRPVDDLTDALQRMHAQAVQMQFMLDDFLELSRLQAVEPDGVERLVDVAGILRELQEQAKEISRGEHQLTFDIEAGLSVFGISTDLESAFRNLIVNALKYTPEGGFISVTWRNTHEGPVLSVKDTGIGIPRREIPRLTERFYRVGSDRGRKSGGTGLGLAIVKHVMSAHQARLEIESEYGVGSEFRCIFPNDRGPG
jgi:two-component system phosphate regulon sensor histidine kinase PhoR